MENTEGKAITVISAVDLSFSLRLFSVAFG